MSDRRALVVQPLARTFAMIGAALILALVLVGVADGQAYAASSEKEPNDTAQRATALTLGDQCSATISDYSDKDWFRVTLPSAGKFTLGFGHTYSADYG
ncbi:MAG: hypothetical protein HFJ71_09805, partial [Eggerthellaceae bacterium]|nr:hypothetical protein [Eggerthellaceae bacterium]